MIPEIKALRETLENIRTLLKGDKLRTEGLLRWVDEIEQRITLLEEKTP